MIGGIRIGMDYRPCLVDGRKALFHKWERVREIVLPSLTKGGHDGGTVCGDMAIVEYEDGQIAEVKPERIKFVDGIIKQYAFPETETN